MENKYIDTENPKIRYCLLYSHPRYGEIFHFEMFARPYFWGMVGKRRWIGTITATCFRAGYEYTEYLLNEKAPAERDEL